MEIRAVRFRPRERARIGDLARPPGRRDGRADPCHVAARNGTARRALRPRNDVHRRRPRHSCGVRTRRGSGGRAAVSGTESLRAAHAAVDAVDRLYRIARERLRERVVRGGVLDAVALDRDQLAAHALAYVATDLAASQQLLAWASSYPTAETRAIAQTFVAEVARNLRSVVWLGATETYSVSEMHVTPAEV